MARKLRDLEAEEAAKVEDFLAAHPEFSTTEGQFEQDTRERRWVGDRNVTTLPIDPDELSTNVAFRSLFPGTSRTQDQEELMRQVFRVFEQMRADDVEVLKRRYFERMTLDAIAAEEGVSRTAIIKRLQVATRRMQALYDA